MCDARIHVLYVVNTTYADVGATGRTTIDSLRERSETAVRGIEEGDPYREILEYAGNGVDLTVMGTRGRSGIDRYLLGSVTEKVVWTADVPVFTVRGGS